MQLNSTPKQDGFSMPIESYPHDGTIVLLPYRKDTWKNDAKDALDEFYEIVSNIARFENVYLVCDSHIDEAKLERFKLDNVHIIKLDYNDSWARDNTLIFLKKDNEIRAVDFRFNAWGGKVDGLYDYWEDDDKLGESLAKYFNVDYYKHPSFILEGGSIHTNGNGVFLTTKACLHSLGRNSYLSHNEIDKELKEYLNAKDIIYLDHGIVNDETNEHVDNVCCFIDEKTVMIAYTNDESDLQYEYIKGDLEVLENYRFSDGDKLNIIKVKLPKPMYLTKSDYEGLEHNDISKPRLDGDRLAASYINFYLSDKFVLLPQFGVEEDKIAYEQFKEIFKDKEVIKIYSKEILLAGGNIHCVTMQVPKGVKHES